MVHMRRFEYLPGHGAGMCSTHACVLIEGPQAMTWVEQSWPTLRATGDLHEFITQLIVASRGDWNDLPGFVAISFKADATAVAIRGRMTATFRSAGRDHRLNGSYIKTWEEFLLPPLEAFWVSTENDQHNDAGPTSVCMDGYAPMGQLRWSQASDEKLPTPAAQLLNSQHAPALSLKTTDRHSGEAVQLAHHPHPNGSDPELGSKHLDLRPTSTPPELNGSAESVHIDLRTPPGLHPPQQEFTTEPTPLTGAATLADRSALADTSTPASASTPAGRALDLDHEFPRSTRRSAEPGTRYISADEEEHTHATAPINRQSAKSRSAETTTSAEPQTSANQPQPEKQDWTEHLSRRAAHAHTPSAGTTSNPASASLLTEAPKTPPVVDIDERLTVLSVLCANGHPNPPRREGCYICGAPVVGRQQMMPRPALGVVTTSTGEQYPLDRDVLFGRAPAPVDQSRPEPHLVYLDAAEISANHVMVKVDGWSAVALDRRSTNGTTLIRPGLVPTLLEHGVEVPLQGGDILDMGDGITATIGSLP